MSLSLSTTGFPKEQYDHLPAVVPVLVFVIVFVFCWSGHLPAVRVVPVEGKVVCEPGVDVVEAHLLTGRIGQGLIITIINCFIVYIYFAFRYSGIISDDH